MSMVMQNMDDKSYLLNILDTPGNEWKPLFAAFCIAHLCQSTGHTNFIDEVTAATRLVDGAVIIVDVVEGVW